jgi:hypothetical protein
MWWDIYSPAMNNFTLSEQTMLHKFTHRRLACNHCENLYYEYHDPLCYCCKIEIETQDHIITCTLDETRQGLKLKYCKDLSKIMINTNTDDNLRRVICECTRAWINGKEIPSIEELTDNPSQLLMEAYDDQTLIGWSNFMRGRLTEKWGTIYTNTNTADTHNDTQRVTSKKWGKDIVTLNWKFFLNMWTERNQIEHGRVKDEANARTRSKLITKIKWLHHRVKDKVTEFGNDIENEQLETLPLANLEILENQM